DGLEAEKPVRGVEFSDDQWKMVKNLHLLTSKPALYAANVGENDVADPDKNEDLQKVREYAVKENAEVIVVCAKIEEEIAELDPEEKEMFLDDLGIAESGQIGRASCRERVWLSEV